MPETSTTLMLFSALLTMGAGLAAATAAGEQKGFPVRVLFASAASSLICFAAGAAAAVANLGRPSMIFGVLANPGTPIFEQFVLLSASMLAVLVYLAALYRGAQATTCAKIAAAAALLAIALVFVLGKSRVMPWRAAWNTWTLVLSPLGWTAVFAAAGFALMASRAEDDPHPVWLAGGAVTALICAAIYLAALAASGNGEAVEAAGRALTGSVSSLFWGGMVLCGVFIPLAASFAMRRAPAVCAAISMAGAFAAVCCNHLLVSALGERLWQFFG